MTGPEHFAEAERRVHAVNAAYLDGNMTSEEAALGIAAAQVHATLAQVAATVSPASVWSGVIR